MESTGEWPRSVSMPTITRATTETPSSNHASIEGVARKAWMSVSAASAQMTTSGKRRIVQYAGPVSPPQSAFFEWEVQDEPDREGGDHGGDLRRRGRSSKARCGAGAEAADIHGRLGQRRLLYPADPPPSATRSTP